MNKINVAFVFFLLFSSALIAQSNNSTSTNTPVSIYTFNQPSNNSTSTIFKNLNLTDYSFVFVDQIDIDTNMFSINFSDIGKNPSAFIYDDYKRYQNTNLLKGFLVKNDPTRWHNSNFKSYNQLKKELK